MNSLFRIRALFALSVLCIININIGFSQKKILIVGDSWAETIWRTNALDETLQEYGYPAGLTEGGQGDAKSGNLTAIGGSMASQWASNHLGWRLRIEELISKNPSISIIHLIIGGNDLLKLISKSNVLANDSVLRQKEMNNIIRNIQQLVEFCLALNPDIKVLIQDYDFLNIVNTKVYGFNFGGMSQMQVNDFFVDLGMRKMALAAKYSRCFYIQNWGVLNNYYANHADSLYYSRHRMKTDVMGSLLSLPAKADVGDGVHPNEDAHKVMLRLAVEYFYKRQLPRQSLR